MMPQAQRRMPQTQPAIPYIINVGLQARLGTAQAFSHPLRWSSVSWEAQPRLLQQVLLPQAQPYNVGLQARLGTAHACSHPLGLSSLSFLGGTATLVAAKTPATGSTMTVPTATGSSISRDKRHSGHTPMDFSVAAVDIIDKCESSWA